MSRSTSSQTVSIVPLLAVAACSIAVTAANEIQLLPDGEFRAADGRPTDAPAWHLDAALAQTLINAAAARGTPYVIDYEHQTLLARQNGQPAPAAGFFQKLEWRDGIGLFAIDVEWTERAQAMIAAGEYKFISPVIAYDKATGNVTALYMAAITNNPAIHGMEEVLLAAATSQFTPPTQLTSETYMEELLQQLRWLLNLPIGATAEDILAQLQKLTDTIKQGKGDTATAAANFDLIGHLEAQRSQIASLSAATPDPAKYAPIQLVQDLQKQLAALTAQANAGRVDELVQAALSDGRLVPSMEAWARDLGTKDIAALSSFLDTAPKIAALTGMQTNGNPPSQAATGSLTQNQVALCNAMGISQDDFLKTLQAEKRA